VPKAKPRSSQAPTLKRNRYDAAARRGIRFFEHHALEVIQRRIGELNPDFSNCRC
jgi:hypothetical protein